MAEKKAGGGRLVYLDLLRIVSVVMMVTLHISGVGMRADIGSFDWHVCNIYDGITHICVPVFIMISGAFLLDPEREYSIKKLYKVKILRIVTAFVFWSLFYAVIRACRSTLPFGKKFVLEFLTDFLKGEFHLWFMFMIAGLYMITPILRKITQDKKLTEYFLILSCVFMFGLSNVALYSLHGRIDEIFLYIDEKANMDFVFGYTFYYVAGYYFKRYSPGKKFKTILYIGGLVSAVIIPLGTYYYSAKLGENLFIIYAFQSPFIGLLSISSFVLFKDLFCSKEFGNGSLKVISFLSKYSFGVYLVHAALIDALSNIFGINCFSFNTVFSVPLLGIGVFAVSLLIIYLVGKIPVLNKYIM